MLILVNVVDIHPKERIGKKSRQGGIGKIGMNNEYRKKGEQNTET
jgi:hypothetical protein